MRNHILLLPLAILGSACISVTEEDGSPCNDLSCGPNACCVVGCGEDPAPRCIEPPDVCIDIAAPVCGCDGETYGNACEARAACVAIDHDGPCNVGEECGDAVCAEGQCCVESCGGVDDVDACIEPPDVCPEIYGPVCGCDGITYDNACMAHAACVAIDELGPCEPSSICGDDVCTPGQCCLESCGGQDVGDVCIEPPVACTADYSPVCGCDGTTYGNACSAHASCVAIDRDGPCEPTCGDATCGADQCCLSSCGGVDPVDECIVAPEVCPDLWAPVCGCDGVTYGNACEAHAACTAVLQDGECGARCEYSDPGRDGCEPPTIECPIGGPAIRCIGPDSYDACCCPECV